MSKLYMNGLASKHPLENKPFAKSSMAGAQLHFCEVMDANIDGIILIDRASMSIVYINDAVCQLYNQTRTEILSQTSWNFLSLTRPYLELAYDNLIAGDIVDIPLELQLQQQNCSSIWVELRRHAHCYDDGWVIITQVRNITERKHAEAELRIAAVAFQSHEAMMVTDPNGVIIRVNDAFTEISGYSPEEVVGQTTQMLQSGRHGEDFFRDMWKTIYHTGGWRGEVWDRRKSGEIYPKWLIISSVKDNNGDVTHYIGAHSDISELKKADERINELAFFDPLTGLPNRTLLQNRLQQALATSSRDDSYGALLFIDLDDFKSINDAMGHEVGDQLLKQVAQRLTLLLRDGDTVARIGGDEFVVILKRLGSHEKEAVMGTKVAAEQLLIGLAEPYQISDTTQLCSSSIGATLFKGYRLSFDELMKQADLSMYKSKAEGRNALHLFDPEMEVEFQSRATLEGDLRLALKEHQFMLHYQAQMVDEDHLTGAEVLLRWMHPVRGMVFPAEFIPLAEETKLILPLGNWVLKTACLQLTIWATQPEMEHLTLSVNISAQQIRQPDFVEQVLAVLDETCANPLRLKLELTESLLVNNVQDIIEKMLALKAKGVGFSLDDFGTGYSSLNYLKRLPLDQLKIDQSFVRDILIDPNDAAIAKTVVALADILDLWVIAEGVETSAQRDFLSYLGCHAYQGYFFSKPLPIDDFVAFARTSLPSLIKKSPHSQNIILFKTT
jgi:diguanylate cyclase (GGDEF)-like protein/PAS domain S-box-containing protein